MNTKNIVAALVAALSVGSSFAAAAKTNVVTIAGSTAYRTAAYAALDNYYNGGSNAVTGWTRVARSGSDNTSAYALYKNADGTQFISVHWSGSEGGLQAVAGQKTIKNTFLPLNASGDSASTASLISTNVNIAFADVKQTQSRFIGTGAKGLGDTTKYDTLPAPAEVANLGFVWAGSSNFPTNINLSITKEVQQELFANGNVPLSRFSGNTNDTAKVYLVGRNVDSGTRCAALLNAGLPNTASIQQNLINSDGTVAPYPAETIVGLNCPTGLSGYGSGSGVANALGYLTNVGGPYAVGYVGRGDYNSAKNVLLNHEGAVISAETIKTGAYPFWTTENIYTQAKPSANVSAVAANLAAGCSTYATDVTGKVVNLADMKVKRTVDAGPIIVK